MPKYFGSDSFELLELVLDDPGLGIVYALFFVFGVNFGHFWLVLNVGGVAFPNDVQQLCLVTFSFLPLHSFYWHSASLFLNFTGGECDFVDWFSCSLSWVQSHIPVIFAYSFTLFFQWLYFVSLLIHNQILVILILCNRILSLIHQMRHLIIRHYIGIKSLKSHARVSNSLGPLHEAVDAFHGFIGP